MPQLLQIKSIVWSLTVNASIRDFGFQSPSRFEPIAKHADKKETIASMRRSCSDSPVTASQMDGVFGSDTQFESLSVLNWHTVCFITDSGAAPGVGG